MSKMTNVEKAHEKLKLSAMLFVAFSEGWSSYASAANSMITFEEAWKDSATFEECEKLKKEADDLLFYS